MDHLPLDLADQAVPRYGLGLTASGLAPRSARALAAAALDEWGMGGLRDDVDLVVSELVTNAVLRSPCAEFMIALRGEEIEVAVWDDAPGLPKERHGLDPAAALDGRGLLLVREFSNAWGHRLAPGGGKVVWARLGPKPKE